jgi:hypothetical protein
LASDCAEASHTCSIAKLPYYCLQMYLSGRTPSLRTIRSWLPRYLQYCTVHLLPTPPRAVLLIICGQTVSSPVGSSHKTVVRKSARRVNSYLDTYLEYVHSWLPILLQLSSHLSRLRLKRPPRACSTCVPRKANRAWLTSHCMSLVAAADSETTHTTEVQEYKHCLWGSPWGTREGAGYLIPDTMIHK